MSDTRGEPSHARSSRSGLRGLIARPGAADRPGPRVVLAIVAVVLLALNGAVRFHERSVLVLARSAVALTGIEAGEGRLYRATLPHDAWSEIDGPPRTVLREDGRVLGPGGARHEDIRRLGSGRYSVWGGTVLFSTPDNAEPGAAERAYVLSGPTPVPPLVRTTLAVLGIVMLAWAVVAWTGASTVASTAPGTGDQRRVLIIAVALFVLALAARAGWQAIVTADPVAHTQPFRVMGMPYTDARGWDTSGESLLRGAGLLPVWKGMRPFYAVFLAMLYFWTGPSSAVAVAANIVLGAAAVPFVFLIGRAAGSARAGLLAAIAIALHPQMVDVATTVQSETLGHFLCVGSTWLVISGLRGSAGRLLTGGAAFGLSNLTRPATLLALPVLAVIAGVSRWRRAGTTAAGAAGERRLRRRGAIGAIVALLLGAGIALGPWMVRQRIEFGFWSISANSAAVLYAATTPDHGAWTPAVSDEAAQAGHGGDLASRYAYYTERARANIRADPAWYVRHVLASTAAAVGDLGRVVDDETGRHLVWAMLLAAWLAGVTSCPRRGPALMMTAVASGVAIALATVGAPAVGVLAGLGVLGGLRVRPGPALVLIATEGATAVALGLTGGLVMERVNVLVLWIGALFIFGGVDAVLRGAAGGLGGGAVAVEADGPATVVTAPRAGSTPARRRGRAAAAVVAAIAIGVPVVVLVHRNLVAPRPPVFSATVDQPDSGRIIAALRDLLAASPDGAAPVRRALAADDTLWPRVVIHRADISRFQYRLPPEATFPRHWSRHLEPRGYERTYFQLGLLAPQLDVMHGGRLDDVVGAEAIVVAVPRRWQSTQRDNPLFEAIAVVPLGPDGEPDWRAARLGSDAHLGYVLALATGDAKP